MNSSIYLTLLFFWMTRGKVYMMFVIALGFRYFKHIYLDKCTLFEVKKIFLLPFFTDCVNCIYTKTPIDLVTVELGDSVTLNCTYNCSSGFVQGYWSKALDIFGCHMMFREGSFCTVFLCLNNVSAGHLKNNYTCYTVDKEDPQLQQKTERLFLLQLRGR